MYKQAEDPPKKEVTAMEKNNANNSPTPELTHEISLKNIRYVTQLSLHCPVVGSGCVNGLHIL